MEPPSYTKPIKIENPEPTAAIDPATEQKQSLDESILKVINNLMSATEQSNQLSSTAGGYLRQIAENTATAQNL